MRAPTEIKSTPVSAIGRTVSRSTPPGGLQRRPLAAARVSSRSPTASRRVSGSMLSSSSRSAPVAERVGDLVEVAALDLDGELGVGAAGAVDGLRQAAGERDVVLLDQDRVVEADPVVAPAAGGDRRLLESAQARGRLTGVENRGAGAGDRLDVARRERGDPREVTEEVERRALGGEQRPRPGPTASRTSAGTSSRHWPSTTRLSMSTAPHCRIASATAARPKTTPGCFWTIRARPRASSGTVASEVTSPPPMSSARARATISLRLCAGIRHRRSLDQREVALLPAYRHATSPVGGSHTAAGEAFNPRGDRTAPVPDAARPARRRGARRCCGRRSAGSMPTTASRRPSSPRCAPTRRCATATICAAG